MSCRPRRRTLRGPRRMFWRIYLYGALLLFAVALGVGATSRLIWGGEQPERFARAARYLAAELGPLRHRPAELQARLERLHGSFDVDLAVYDATGVALARVGDAPPAPHASYPSQVRHERRGRRVLLTVPLAPDAYLVGVVRLPASGAEVGLLVLVVAGVLALVALPLARGLARPIERITAAARALGEGDLTARTGVQRRDELGELARAFDAMAERIDRLLSSERELLANVSHELRTPLARIRVALELAEESGAGAELRGIGADLAELERLIEDILATARLDLGPAASSRQPLRLGRVRIAELVAQAAARFARNHPEHNLTVTTEQARDLWLAADAPLLRRVLDNLLDNAAKYADASAGPIELEARPEDADSVLLEVRDRGIGVDPADLPRLFAPFFRTDRSRARGTGGVGLGLTLCRRIVEAHGGTIEALSNPAGGLTLRVRLPK